MSNSAWLSLLKKHRAIAVIRYSQLKLGLHMAQAAANGGMRLLEVTWNSDQPEVLISQLREQFPLCTIGAGTILNLAQLHQAVACGAQFLVSPHLNPNLIQAALAAQIPYIPGALSPTEIVLAWQNGASGIKVFPIQALGGVKYLQHLQAPLGDLPLIPTGGVTLDNAQEFIAAGAIAVAVGGDLFPSQLVTTDNWQAIAQRAEQLKKLWQN